MPTLASELVWPGEQWQIADTEQMHHWSRKKLAEAESYWKEQGSTAVIVVENGRIVVAWGECDRPIQCHSVRKSLLSVLYGIYRERAQIDLTKTLEALGIDDKSGLTSVEKQASIGDLLKARSGVYHEAAYETKGMKARKPERGSHLPGEFWYYNNWDFNALGGIFTGHTGKNVFEAFEESIAQKIGMQDFDREAHTRYVYNAGSKFPAYTFQLSTRDRARFGLLCLANGRWNDEQIVPEDWMEESTRPHSTPRSRKIGYGYMWWTTRDGQLHGSNFEGHAYAANGNHGQRITIIPDLKMVVVQSVDHNAGDAIAEGTTYDGLLARILAARRPVLE